MPNAVSVLPKVRAVGTEASVSLSAVRNEREGREEEARDKVGPLAMVEHPSPRPSPRSCLTGQGRRTRCLLQLSRHERSQRLISANGARRSRRFTSQLSCRVRTRNGASRGNPGNGLADEWGRRMKIRNRAIPLTQPTATPRRFDRQLCYLRWPGQRELSQWDVPTCLHLLPPIFYQKPLRNHPYEQSPGLRQVIAHRLNFSQSRGCWSGSTSWRRRQAN